MIYKTKKEYWTLETREDKPVKIKNRGYKIVVNDLTFYSDEEYVIKKITEESTGTGINVKAKDLQEAEQILIANYNKISKQLKKVKSNPNYYDFHNLEEWKD